MGAFYLSAFWHIPQKIEPSAEKMLTTLKQDDKHIKMVDPWCSPRTRGFEMANGGHKSKPGHE